MIIDLSYRSNGIHLVVITGIKELYKTSTSEDKLWVSKILSDFPEEIESLKSICRTNNIILSIMDIDDHIDYAKKVKNAYQRA